MICQPDNKTHGMVRLDNVPEAQRTGKLRCYSQQDSAGVLKAKQLAIKSYMMANNNQFPPKIETINRIIKMNTV